MSKMSQMAMERDEAEAEKLNEKLTAAATKINKGDRTESKKETNIVKAKAKTEPKNVNTQDPVTPQVKEMSEFDSFKAYVNSAGLAIKKPDGSVYLKAEAWLYLAHLKEVVPSVEVIPVYGDFGHIIRCTAVCKLFDKDGEEVSQAAMIASKDEAFLKDLDDYAVVGMAETRAITRCLRNVYGYVAKGAGFESTPAVEMGLEKDMVA